MPHRRAPLLALLLALALVAYPVTMPVAMATESPSSMPMPMHGSGACPHGHQPAPHQHPLSACCAGVCGSCPIIAMSAGVAPRLRASNRAMPFQNDLPAAPEQSAVRRLPYSIGPPARRA